MSPVVRFLLFHLSRRYRLPDSTQPESDRDQWIGDAVEYLKIRASDKSQSRLASIGEHPKRRAEVAV